MEEKVEIGLVLSGGGAKGAAHIGVLKAIEERNIKIDVISGTSSGAIIGALFAEGYSSEAILDLYLSTSVFKPGYFTWRKPGIIDTDALGKILEPMLEHDEFEKLKIPLYIVATDVENVESTVFDSGPLIKAILSSSSFPGIFAPVNFNEKLYVDGGVLNNFPVDIIRDKCNTLIGANVQIIDFRDKSKFKSTFSLVQRVFTISIRSESLTKYKDCDVLIAPKELANYATFNIFKMKEMYKIGYEEASKQLDLYLKTP